MPIDTEVDKEAVVHTCNGILLGQKKEKKKTVSFAEMWMDPEGITQSEVQLEREKQVLNKITYIMESRKMVEMNLFAKLKESHRLENKLTVTKG